jgi:hypothetical protein
VSRPRMTFTSPFRDAIQLRRRANEQAALRDRRARERHLVQRVASEQLELWTRLASRTSHHLRSPRRSCRCRPRVTP